MKKMMIVAMVIFTSSCAVNWAPEPRPLLDGEDWSQEKMIVQVSPDVIKMPKTGRYWCEKTKTLQSKKCDANVIIPKSMKNGETET